MAIIVDGTKEYRMGYMRGAMEQQLITIRIACDWLKEHARAFGSAEATGVWDATYKYDSDMLVEQFCRAMQDARSHAEAVCQAAVDRMGIDSQVIMAIEEMAELTDALCKSKRGRNTPADIITEIADVQIMMEQLSLYYGKDAVAAERSRKIDRLENRLQLMQKVD